jgi:hypothetical protein
MSPDQLAALASSLRSNEAFKATLDGQRSAALERLATLSPDDKNSIIAAQAIVAVVDGINADLDQFIRAGQPKSKPGIA